MTTDTFDTDVLAPRLADVAEQHADKITVVKVDVDANPTLAADHRVVSLPTMTLFVDGVATMSLSGAKSEAAILDSLAAWL